MARDRFAGRLPRKDLSGPILDSAARPLWRRRLVSELTRHDVEINPETTAASTGGTPAPNGGNGGGALTGGNNSPMLKSKDDNSGSIAPPVHDQNAGAQPKAEKLSEWSPVKPDPRTLMLTPEERDYMVSLSAVIGRSPRSVKRFVNCYRLLKSTMDPAELARATRSGTFRTSMLLLGIVTGFPEAAPALLADLRDARRNLVPEAWARAAAKRLKLEERGKWAELLPVIVHLRQWDVKNLVPLAEAAKLVDRFSFSPVQRPVEELV